CAAVCRRAVRRRAVRRRAVRRRAVRRHPPPSGWQRDRFRRASPDCVAALPSATLPGVLNDTPPSLPMPDSLQAFSFRALALLLLWWMLSGGEGWLFGVAAAALAAALSLRLTPP
ncbi:hypothetical protein RZS08_29615, partial [Arthrospira platensis SPKY1]|nr:hypothetical protein [Arthrospira platensis SPKY1]